MRYRYKKGQALVEMALFGSLVLLILGTLLSYIQRMNDQQYVQMEAFRRALEKGCTYLGEDSGGAGASVQFTLLQHRKHSDVGGGFRKGSTQTSSGSSNIFWAVPKVGADAESLLVYRINDEEKQFNYADLVPKEEKDASFQTEDIISSSNITFNEVDTKDETPEAITNTRTSQLEEAVTMEIPYKITRDDSDDDPDNDPVIEEGTLWEVEQGLYRDADGQYRYNSEKVGTVVERGRTWRTDF